MAHPYRVIFVCLGNICRSPTAAAVFRRLVQQAGLADQVTVDSAGTGGWHVGDRMDPRAAEVLRMAGYDDAHVARQFRPDWFDRADRVVAMDGSNLAALRTMAAADRRRAPLSLLMSYDPVAVQQGRADVPDPYYGGAGGFVEVLDLVERGCRGLLEAVRADLAARAAVAGPAAAGGETRA